MALPSRETLARSGAVGAAALLTAGMAWLLVQPGRTASRTVLFLVVVAFGWMGAFGVVSRRPTVGATGAVGLVLLGFWQAVAWIVILPAAAVLLAAAAASGDRNVTAPAVDDPA